MPTLVSHRATLPSASPDERHRLRNQLPAGIVVDVRATHSFIGLPFPASNGNPSPDEISSATRPAGSLTTSRSSTSIAKIDLLILIAFDPNPLPPSGTVTPLRRRTPRTATRTTLHDSGCWT